MPHAAYGSIQERLTRGQTLAYCPYTDVSWLVGKMIVPTLADRLATAMPPAATAMPPAATAQCISDDRSCKVVWELQAPAQAPPGGYQHVLVQPQLHCKHAGFSRGAASMVPLHCSSCQHSVLWQETTTMIGRSD